MLVSDDSSTVVFSADEIRAFPDSWSSGRVQPARRFILSITEVSGRDTQVERYIALRHCPTEVVPPVQRASGDMRLAFGEMIRHYVTSECC